MSEYMEKHAVSRLVGAPPGYVGYEEGGQLTEAIRRRPYAVILLDEIEKAHGDVFNILLQVLDDGRLTDSHGRTVDFRNAILIMTSNAGLGVHPRRRVRGARCDARVEGVLRDDVPARVPEPRRRDGHLPAADGRADPLRSSTCSCRASAARLADRKIELEVTDEARDLLGREGYDPAFGARPLKRVVQRRLENPLALAILEGRIGDGDRVVVDADGEELSFASAPGRARSIGGVTPPLIDLGPDEDRLAAARREPLAVVALPGGVLHARR